MNQLRLMRRCAWRQAGLSEIEILSFAAEFSLSYAVERRHLGVRDAVQVPLRLLSLRGSSRAPAYGRFRQRDASELEARGAASNDAAPHRYLGGLPRTEESATTVFAHPVWRATAVGVFPSPAVKPRLCRMYAGRGPHPLRSTCDRIYSFLMRILTQTFECLCGT